MAVIIDHRTADKENKCQTLFRQNRLLVILICFIVIGVIIGTLLLLIIPVLFEKEPRHYRLPADVLPYQYKLEIKPYLTPGDFRFEGQVEIYVSCVRKTDLIVLHSRNLTIDEGSVKVSNIDDGGYFKVLIDYDPTNDQLLLRLLEDLKKGQTYRIFMKFEGTLGEGERGFYISTYKDDEEITHYVASTHFEPVDARTTFPCFDEPEFKSAFNITLVRWENMTSLSNMPRVRTENREENWKADIFEKSMKMSTYLVAFIFSDYVGMTKGKVTVWAPKHRINDAAFALNISQIALNFYEEKLGIPYPGPKIDMVPVTSLEAGAMENWGLIIFQESMLLISEDKGTIDSATISEIAATVAHEIAHQWFGNLVTIKWWSDIWLNEGITSYMEDLVKAKIFPDWNKVDPTIQVAYDYMNDDCSESVPIWHPVHNSKDARNSFDGGTYPKGSMMTRMAHQILGEEAFWKGIRRYLKSNAYKNVEEADLWRYLTAAQLPESERLDMAEIMYSWTHLSGIPIVTVHRNYSSRTATISQRSCKSNKKEYENYLWNIPIIIESKFAVNVLNKMTWLKKRSATFEEMPYKDDWIVVNGDSVGFYIVNYDRENWKLLFNQMRVNHQLFDHTQRFKFLAEIIEFERRGDIEIDLVFEYFIYLKEERNIELFGNNFLFMNNYVKFFDEEKYQELLREFLIYIWKNIYDTYGWRGREDYPTIEIFSVTTVSPTLIKNLCDVDYEPCIEEAVGRYSTLKQERTTVNDESLSIDWIALCTVVKNATYDEWNEIKDNHFDENSDNLTFALMCSKVESVIRSELFTLFEVTKNAFDWFIFAASEYKGSFDETMKFFDQHFENLTKSGLEWQRQEMSKGINASRMKKMIQMLSKHLKNLSGSSAQNLESFIELLKKRLPELEKKTRILKEWLEKKPWLQLA